MSGAQTSVTREDGANGLWIGFQIEETSQASDDRRQGRKLPEADGRSQPMAIRFMAHRDIAGQAAKCDGAAVDTRLHGFNPRNRAGAEEREHRRPIIGRSIAEGQADSGLVGDVCGVQPAQFRGRPTKERPQSLIESTHASKSGGEGNLRHGELRLMNQLLGDKHAACLGDGDLARLPRCLRNNFSEGGARLDAQSRSPGIQRRPRPARQDQSGPWPGKRCWKRRARRPTRVLFPGGSAGTGESRPPAPRRRWDSSGNSPVLGDAPGRSVGSRCQWR